MNTLRFASCTFVFAFAACDEPAAPVPADGSPKAYGAAIAAGPGVAIATVLGAPADYEGKQVLVSGHVRKACTFKGCWMELTADGAPEGQGCRVTFKDYGFFVPLDSAGASARVEGVVSTTVVSKDHVEHLESEGARFAAKLPDGSAREVRLVAHGVELTAGPKS